MKQDLLAGVVVAVLMVAVALLILERQPSAPSVPPATAPHPRVMEATSPLVVYTVEQPAPRARVWAIEERAAWYSDADRDRGASLERLSDPPPPAEPSQSAAPLTAAAQPEPNQCTNCTSSTPEPTAIVIPASERDHMAGLTRDDVRAAARAAGWPEAQVETVVRVAECESGLRPWEVGAAGEVGLMQIHPVHAHLHARYDLREPVQNMLAALEVWQASGWGAWSCA